MHVVTMKVVFSFCINMCTFGPSGRMVYYVLYARCVSSRWCGFVLADGPPFALIMVEQGVRLRLHVAPVYLSRLTS